MQMKKKKKLAIDAILSDSSLSSITWILPKFKFKEQLLLF